MNTAENSDSVVSMPRRWWSAIKGSWVKVPRLLRFILVVIITIGLIGAGAYIYAKHSARADTATLVSQVSGTAPQLDQQGHPLRLAERPFLAKALRSAIAHDRWVILGSFLVLFTCASIFTALMSYSKSRTKLSHFILAAVLVATTAHLLENTLIYGMLDRPRSGLLGRLPDTFWIESSAAMNAVRWAALVVAVAAIPAALFSAFLRILSYLRLPRYRRRCNGRNWWDAALWSPAPEPVEADTDTEAAWRQAYCVPDAAELVAKHRDCHVRPTALCLSGGGIRSACVSMGAIQTFAGPRGDDGETYPPVLDSFDWVISVSGGGFSAGALLLGVQCEATTDGRAGGAMAPLCERFSPGSVEFDFLRRRSSYIAGSPLELLRALAEVLKNLLASLLIVSLSAIILGWLLGMFVARLPLAAVVTLKQAVPLLNPELPHHPVAALAAIAIPVVGAMICIALRLFCEWFSTSPWSAKWQARFAWLGEAAALLALLVFVLTVAGPGLMWLCQQRPDKGPAAAIGGIAAVVILQYGATLSMMSKKQGFLNPSRWLKFVPSGVVRIALVLLTLGVLLIGWLLVLGIVAGQVFNVETGDPRLAVRAVTSDPMTGWLGLIALLALLLSSFDVTSLSLHPFYRQRLARTFAVRRLGGEAVEYECGEATWLDKYGKAQDGGPKFVFAAAAAISEGPIRPPPGLNAVSFVMTADYIGGPALGWLKTPELRQAAPPRIQRDLTVEGAVAVSAAAFGSAMGRQNKGIQTLLALSGARLGTWLPNPTFVRNAQCHAAKLSFPKALPWVRGAGYFYRELFGINKFDARLVQVTDGGHYENLGLVEALRRRCRLIYCIDGGGGAAPLLSGLADAIRLARFELGVEITLENGGPFGVENLAPGSGDQFGDGHGFHSLNARITKGAVVRGQIKYPRAAGLGDEASCGWLIVAKAVLWRELPDWVLTHAAERGGAKFPDDNTSDQWFTEGQFAAYTELGRRIAVHAMRVEVPRPKSPLEVATNGEGHAESPTTAPGMAKPL